MHARELELVTETTTAPARQGSACVRERVERGYLLEDEGGVRLVARRALGCLVEPQVGDRVWFASEAGVVGEAPCWLISVLEREADVPTTLSVPGSLRVAAGEELELSSDRLRVRARAGEILIGECMAILRKLATHVGTSSLFAKVVETLTERLSVHAKSSLRAVEGLDQVQAGHVELRAEGAAHVSAKQVLVQGAELVKADGHQIHLG